MGTPIIRRGGTLNMSKIVIVINGKGGAGKDTICDIVSQHYNTMNVSSIDPIKEIALKYGWNGGKDNKSRKFLADLKRAFIEYNDLPNNYLKRKYDDFMSDDNKNILFVHIREADQIDAFKTMTSIKCVTLLVTGADSGELGNLPDDETGEYSYDYYYDNTGPIEDLQNSVMDFFGVLLKNESIALTR